MPFRPSGETQFRLGARVCSNAFESIFSSSMACLVCLEDGGGAHGCGCSCTTHTPCLLALLDNDYSRCPNCFVEFSNAAVLEAAKLAVEQEGATKRLIFYGAALTAANQPLRAIKTLLDDGINLDTECVIARWHVEIGSAYLSAGMPQMSKMHLETAVTRLQRGSPLEPAVACLQQGLPPQSLYARALVGLAQTCLRMGDVGQASNTMLKAISLTKWLAGAECVAVMRVIAHICRATGDKRKSVDAHATICEILDHEEPDPWACAKGQAELGLAEIECGKDASNRLRGALNVLRKRPSTYEPILGAAARGLASLVRPRKRLRWKRHPESV